MVRPASREGLYKTMSDTVTTEFLIPSPSVEGGDNEDLVIDLLDSVKREVLVKMRRHGIAQLSRVSLEAELISLGRDIAGWTVVIEGPPVKPSDSHRSRT